MAKKKTVTALTSKKRLVFFFIFVLIMFMVIACRIGYIQIVKADEYSAMATEQQTRDVPISAKRGEIYDANMNALAINESMSTIWVRPQEVKAAEKTNEGYAKRMAKTLSEILPDMTEEDIYAIITKDSSLVKLVKYADDETTGNIRAAMMPEKGKKLADVTGLQIAETVRRYYPMGSFASHVIGSTNDDNIGMSGIELYYDQYLNGTAGRWIKSTDVSGRNLTNGIEKYYEAEDGLGVVLTIDEVIQHFVEKAIEQVQVDTDSDRVMAIAMNPKTGEVLAMACYPDFDLNDPRTPLFESEQEKVAELSDAEKVEYWNDMWRNPLINDTYEPGSPFKLLTTSIALEEGLTSINDTFTCNATVNVAGQTLKCWKYPNAHGTETLAKGVANSCNPVFIALAQRVGIEKFYDYMNLYEISGTTGIDYPGEATGILQSKDTAGPVGLATMGYGQGIACTPIQLMTALCTIGNGGKLMQPHLVKELVDEEGNLVEEFPPTVVRQVVSEQTAADVCQMMEGVVSDGTGKAAYLPGYRVGGKTGTAQKAVNGRYTDYTFSSFFAMAPMDDPQFAVLVIADSPKGVHYGSQTAGPGVKSILSDALSYLGVQPVYTDAEQKEIEAQMVTVPDVKGLVYEDALKQLESKGLTAIACPTDAAEFEVVDQYPAAGQKVNPGNSICLYRE